ncbi:MAG: glycosyltransferase [Acidimicrobiales bacterium]|nr:glycosyltransferase [Acidimicrobiales bacterium]
MALRLGVVSEFWAPAERAGGARSTARALAAMGDVEAFVVAGDRDVGDTEPWPASVRPPPDADGWSRLDGHRVRYVGWDRAGRATAMATLAEVAPDVVYLPSLLAPGSRAVLRAVATRRLAVPVVVAPEGELHPGAMAHHRGRKEAYLRALRVGGVLGRVWWRAADDEELAQIVAAGAPEDRCVVAPDLLGPAPGATPSSSPPAPKRPGSARAVFVGSIVPKKGVPTLLDRAWTLRHDLQLDLYGPVVDPAVGAAMDAVLARCEADVRWRHHGAVPHAVVLDELAHADVLVLPTAGENYGYVVVEALEAGCAVLTSDATPWHDLEASGCGWALPIDEAARWTACLAEVLTWDDGERRRIRAAARARGAAARTAAESAAGAWRTLIERAAGRR